LPICFGKDLFDRLLQPGKIIGNEDPYPLNPAPPEVLKNLFPIPGAFPFRTKEPKPEDLPSSIGLHGFLRRFSSTHREVTGVVTIGACGVCLSVHRPRLSHRGKSRISS
jgi:hypothetical protein